MARRITWDDLQTIHEVARQGSVLTAAKALGVHHSTVTRRVAQVERILEQKLFDRSRVGVKLRSEAADILQQIRLMDTHAETVKELITREGQSKPRVVRVAAMEGIASCYLALRIPTSLPPAARNKIELFSNPHIVDLMKKEADIFVSFFKPDDRRLQSQKVAEFSVFVYGSSSYREKHGFPATREELSRHSFVSYIEDMVTIEQVRWLQELVPSPKVVFCSNSVIAQRSAAQSGLGLVVLPVFVGDAVPGLVRINPDNIRLTRPVWMSVTKEQSYLPSIRAVTRLLCAMFERDRDELLAQGAPKRLQLDRSATFRAESRLSVIR